MPPISSDIFTDKVLQARAATTVQAEKAYFERACEVCQKTYYSENAFQNHLTSQKHKQTLASAGQRPDDETTSVVSSTFTLGDPVPVRRQSVDSDAEEEFNQVVEGFQRTNISKDEIRPSPVKRPSNPQPDKDDADKDPAADRESNNATPVQAPAEPAWSLTSCIFCNYSSSTVTLNVQHMERFHGCFIPEKAYLVDLEGLVDHLQRIVHEGHECLYCGKLKPSVFGLQTHMRDKGHCKIPFTTEQEQLDIGDFYDFRSTYSDDDEEDEEEEGAVKGGVKLGAHRASNYVNEDGDEVMDEGADGWETDSEDGGDAEEGKEARPRRGKNSRPVLVDEHELYLPTGKSIGHRSMNKYYRQNLHSYPTPEERAERQAIEDGRHVSDDEGESGDRRVATRNGGRNGRALAPRGEAGMVGVSDKKRHQVTRAEQRGRTKEAVDTKKYDYAVGKKLNNQKNYYYRYVNGG